MLTVPEGSDDYQKWNYTYNDDGLKIKETGYNKRKQLLGTIEYSYKSRLNYINLLNTFFRSMPLLRRLENITIVL